jgi:hypothetical protein
MQHLMDARERNELAILPSEPPIVTPSARTTFYSAEPGTASSSPSKLSIFVPKGPPSSGTPLIVRLQEEHQGEEVLSQDHRLGIDDDSLDLPSPQYWSNRHTGMFDLDEDQVDIVTHLRDCSLSEAERVLGG